MKKPLSKTILSFITVVLILISSILAWKIFVYFVPAFSSGESKIIATIGYSSDYPVYRNSQTGQYEKIEPMPEAESIGEAYINVRVSKMNSPVGTDVLLTPSNNSKQNWLIIDSDTDGKVKRLTIACRRIMGVAELASRGPIFIQVDIQIDGEWVFGVKQALNSYEICQFILPQHSPFRCYLWKPEGTDWICEYSYTSRWW